MYIYIYTKLCTQMCCVTYYDEIYKLFDHYEI